MTKWFDTNYHYLVPELTRDQAFALRGDKPIAEFLEARALGYEYARQVPGERALHVFLRRHTG